MNSSYSQCKAFVDRHLIRVSRGEKHPVEDFVWTYYGLRPARVLRFSPGVGRICSASDPRDGLPACGHESGGWWIPPSEIPESRLRSMRWIHHLLVQTSARRPFFGCFGLHEWAMVYDVSDTRHKQLPFRLAHEEIREVVQAGPVRCSHFDAFRFFSPSARGFNRDQPTAEGRAEQEQPACLHANMDLLKWTVKLQPWVPSEVMQRAFVIAMAAREVDMRASPYDVSDFGLEAIPIETAGGRKTYREEQRRIMEVAAPVRNDLMGEIERILDLRRGVA